jgi:hypothetical protein
MSLGSLAAQKRFYGRDFVALVGGGLHREGRTLVEAAGAFIEALERGED